MKQHMNYLLLIFSLFTMSCVSVQIGPKKGEPAKNIKFKPPPEPFVSIDSSDVDYGWKNGINSTSISFRSVCNDGVDPTLDSIQQSLIYGLENVQIQKSQRIPFKEREALNSVVVGKLDGIITKMEFVILKKNNCTFTFSYIALEKTFSLDQPAFKNFLNAVEVP